MLARRLRCRSSMEPTLPQCLMLAGKEQCEIPDGVHDAVNGWRGVGEGVSIVCCGQKSERFDLFMLMLTKERRRMAHRKIHVSCVLSTEVFTLLDLTLDDIKLQ